MSIRENEFVFFVSEAEYPNLLSAFPGEFPTLYSDFVSAVDVRIEKRQEQFATTKAYVRVVDFLAFCTKRGIPPDADAKRIFAQLVGNDQVPT